MLLWAHEGPWRRGVSSQDPIPHSLCSTPHRLEGRTGVVLSEGRNAAQKPQFSPLLGLSQLSSLL